MRRENPSDTDGSLRCSFCRQSQNKIRKLISSPHDYPRAYICDECITVCWTILEDEQAEDAEATPDAPGEPHPLLQHSLASELMASVVQWIRQESLGHDASGDLSRLRDIAARMVASGSR